MRKTMLIIVLSVLFAGFIVTAIYLASIDSKSDIFRKWYRRGTGLTKRPDSDDLHVKAGFRYGQPRDKFSRRLSIENTSGREYIVKVWSVEGGYKEVGKEVKVVDADVNMSASSWTHAETKFTPRVMSGMARPGTDFPTASSCGPTNWRRLLNPALISWGTAFPL